tara:strand:- start:225 stop:413 length:189 start_codon:yes stop_codon:yes gene_type:complete
MDSCEEWSPLKKSELMVKSNRSPLGPKRRGVSLPLSVIFVEKLLTSMAVANGKKNVRVRAAI